MKIETTFEQLGVQNEIRKALNLLGYKRPTPVQALVLSHIESTYDLCVKAKTGSGKTAAFGIAACESADWNENLVQTLVIVPTRELAVQVGEELNLLGKFKRLKTAVVFGRMSIAQQELSLKQKTHILVGTPGRINDLIERGSLKLDRIQNVIIDEADEMFYIGLREQVEKILSQIKVPHRTMLFSATLSDEIIELAKGYMNEIKELSMEEEDIVPDITQYAVCVQVEEKLDVLERVLIDKNPDTCVIFANTQEEIEYLYTVLKKRQYPCRRLHGGMKQKERLKVMDGFKRKEFRYLIASDVAARGIDVADVALVINYDCAKSGESYVHRIGRTGRAGKKGEAITLYLEKEEAKIRQMEEAADTVMKKWSFSEQEQVEEKMAKLQEKMAMKMKAVPKKEACLNKEVMKLHINAGKKSKIRTCEIVASICGIEGVTADDIGVIEIAEKATFVEILNRKGNLVLKELPKKTIKGRNRKVHRSRD